MKVPEPPSNYGLPPPRPLTREQVVTMFGPEPRPWTARSLDVFALRRAVEVMQRRSKPRGAFGRVLLRSICRTLLDTADKIERET